MNAVGVLLKQSRTPVALALQAEGPRSEPATAHHVFGLILIQTSPSPSLRFGIECPDGGEHDQIIVVCMHRAPDGVWRGLRAESAYARPDCRSKTAAGELDSARRGFHRHAVRCRGRRDIGSGASYYAVQPPHPAHRP